MTLYVPSGSENTVTDTYLRQFWSESCGYSNTNAHGNCARGMFRRSPEPGWHPDPSFSEYGYCCGGHGGCGWCIMVCSQVLANYHTDVTFVSSTPGAQIFVDGSEWWPGAVTPATFRGIAPGYHTFVYILDGAVIGSGSFELGIDTPVTIYDNRVYGVVRFPDSDATPLYGAIVTVTMYYRSPSYNLHPASGDIKYSHQYAGIYTSASGLFSVDVKNNPFSLFSWDYWEFIANGGWNRASVEVTACNWQKATKSDIIYDNSANVVMYMHHHHTHQLLFKDSEAGALLTNVTATYHDEFENGATKESGEESTVQWTDANPLFITHRCTKDGYKLKTPIINHKGINVSSGCNRITEVMMDRLLTTAFISFHQSRYYPEEVMLISYDSIFVNNCRIKLYDARNNLVMTSPRGSYTNSPPTVNYSLPCGLNSGQWAAVLEDADGNELAHATASVGTLGSLSYDISMRCTEGKIKILWTGVDPVYKSGPLPNYMKIKLYDGAGTFRGDYNISSTPGYWLYIVTGAENFSAKWKAELIDQWGVTIDTILISVFGECSQSVFGHVRRRDGTAVGGVNVTTDLSFMGYGTPTATTDSSGYFKLNGLPPIMPLADVVASKAGFKDSIIAVDLEPDQFKVVDFILEGMINGSVKDVEGSAINDPFAFIDATVEVPALYKDGVYDVECLPGSVTLKCNKKNFQDYSATVTVGSTQVLHNIELLRPVPTDRLVAVETAEASLDDSDTVIIFNTSGQDIVAVDQSIIETPHAFAPWGKYQTMMYVGIRYFAGYTVSSFLSDYQMISELDNNRLHRVLIDDNTKRTLSVGGTISLREGYVLKASDIDLEARTILLSLLKDGTEINVSPLSAGETYIHKKNFSGVYLPIIAVRFENVFSGNELQVAFIRGLFQASESYVVVDAPLPPAEKYLLRAGSRDTTGAFYADSSSNIVIENNGGT